jgi:hypothetical protein
VHALHSWMSALDCTVEPEVECSDDDPNVATFVRATTTIGGQDTVEEFIAYKMFPLASGFGFKDVPVGTTPVSKVQTLLPLFPVEPVSAEAASHVWRRWKLRLRGFGGALSQENMMWLWR